MLHANCLVYFLQKVVPFLKVGRKMYCMNPKVKNIHLYLFTVLCVFKVERRREILTAYTIWITFVRARELSHELMMYGFRLRKCFKRNSRQISSGDRSLYHFAYMTVSICSMFRLLVVSVNTQFYTVKTKSYSYIQFHLYSCYFCPSYYFNKTSIIVLWKLVTFAVTEFTIELRVFVMLFRRPVVQ